ncbi:MAG: glycine dehydrogenase (aminomethyl-transferring) [Spirochaetes bacterium RBG_16_49_21]|nr:MAG: glycine dehydrogenase (aminomethyl-transferring) [Spirochaetes bacterium RBG_16_49_21]
MKHIFEKSVPGRTGVDAGPVKQGTEEKLHSRLRRKTESLLPEVSELDVVRHYVRLSQLNFSVDTHFYPLGSCTMKYNPKVNETVAALPGFAGLHPLMAYLDDSAVQGALDVIYELSSLLAEITGMKGVTTQPYAGAHGELTGILLMAAYHRNRGKSKKYVIVPDEAHGTNPASAAMAGYSVISIPVNRDGSIDRTLLKEKMNDEVAGIMLTLPNTLGIFSREIREIAEMAREHDALLYNDGANLNAILGKTRPGDIGFDIVHMNLHKTFSTPHGSGGPGGGVVAVSERLTGFLPTPVVGRSAEGRYYLDFNVKNSIGSVASFFGNFAILLRALVYITMLGREGLIDVSEKAVLNANYIRVKLKEYYDLPYDRTCMHECVFSAKRQVQKGGIHAIDIAKALIERGFHPPTIYFPLVVSEALMIEPTETESKETIDEFIQAMIEIARLAETDPERIRSAPGNTPVSRPDEAKAGRELKLTCNL